MIIKKYLHIILSIFLISTTHPQSYTPKNTKFAFDLHKVIVEPSKNRVINALRTSNLLPEFNRNLPHNILKGLWHLPQLTFHAIKFLFDDGSGEQYYALVKEYGYDGLAQTILDISNAQEPIAGTIQIMHTLKKLGYTIDIASNIGTAFLEPLKKKYPDIFDLITDTFTVDYNNTPDIRKPNSAYYQKYLATYGDGKKIIFVDDKEENVVAAQQAGMIGIVFKSPEQLREDLITMGIL